MKIKLFLATYLVQRKVFENLLKNFSTTWKVHLRCGDLFPYKAWMTNALEVHRPHAVCMHSLLSSSNSIWRLAGCYRRFITQVKLLLLQRSLCLCFLQQTDLFCINKYILDFSAFIFFLYIITIMYKILSYMT
jgi:hypothetical protein